MAARTFRDVWGLVALHVPGAPVTLVQAWVQDAYDTLWGKRHWSWLRRDALLQTLAARDVTVTLTNGSATVTSTGGFVATDAGRQLRVSGGQIYTVTTYTDANTLVLTEAYAGTSGSTTGTISDIYLVMPADFRSIHTLVNATTQRPIAWWLTQEQLDQWDPTRQQSDSTFRALAGYQLAVDATYAGRYRYEAFPHPTAAAAYRLKYFMRGDALTDDTELPGGLATKARVLVDGALAHAARWPGTADRPNPYFNRALADTHELRFAAECQTLDVLDDDQYLHYLQTQDLSQFGLNQLSGNDSYLRSSAATLD